jgi:hypothetical protein
MRRVVAALALTGGAFASHAAAPEPQWYLQVDNDVVFATDRWYTSGIRLARTTTFGRESSEWGLLQEIYTPESRYFEPGRTDRSPAARLLASYARHQHDENVFQTVEIQLGVRGPAALGEQTTRFVHRIIAADAVDWSLQDSNRIDASAIATRTQVFGPFALHYGAALGTVVSLVHVGAEVRIGAPRARSIYSPMLRFAATPPLRKGNDDFGWGGFIGVSGRGVLRNDLIRHNYEVGAPDVNYERFIARAAAGISWSSSWASASFAVAQDSQEFERQRTPHKFGSLTLSIDF